MSAPLYNSTILRLAAAIPHHERLAEPGATVEKRSPVCGSRVIVDVMLDGEGRVSAIGQQVQACALGQASASLMGANVIGKTAGELEAASASLRDFLAGARDDPGDWPGLDIFAPARPHSARHPSIRLAFEAISEAARAALSVEGTREREGR